MSEAEKEDVMAKKVFMLVSVSVFAMTMIALAADENSRPTTGRLAVDVKTPQSAPATAAVSKISPSAVPMPPRMPGSIPERPVMGMLSGKLVKVDSSDPANVKLDIKSDKDNTVHTLTIMPWTNITRISKVSDLKVGEPVRAISRKIDNKEAAMGIIFGDLEKMKGPAMPSQIPNAKKPETPYMKPENTKK
jgi:hypothetical protein